MRLKKWRWNAVRAGLGHRDTQVGEDLYAGKTKINRRQVQGAESEDDGPEVFNDPDTYQKLAMEQAEIRPVAEKYREYMDLKEQIGRRADYCRGKGIRRCWPWQKKKAGLEETLAKCEEEIKKVLLLPKDPNDGRNAILEIRAGAGRARRGYLLRIF